jgi:hypothetical protein
MLANAVPGPASLSRVRTTLDAIAVSTFEGGCFDEDLLDAVLTSLLEFAIGARDERVLGHPSVIDLMAREILDFPLVHGSLCAYLTDEIAARLMARRDRLAHLVPRARTLRSEHFVRTRRSFYQRRSPAASPARRDP